MPDEDANRPVIVHWGSRDAEPSDLWLATFTATDGSPWRREIDDSRLGGQAISAAPGSAVCDPGAVRWRQLLPDDPPLHRCTLAELRDAFGVT
jgi:hypothetical protein